MIHYAFENNRIDIINILIKYGGHDNKNIQTLIKLLNIDTHSLSNDESLSLLKAIELLIKNTVLFLHD